MGGVFVHFGPEVWEGLTRWVPGDMMCIIGAGVVMFMWYQREMELNPNPPMPAPMDRTGEDDAGGMSPLNHQDLRNSRAAAVIASIAD